MDDGRIARAACLVANVPTILVVQSDCFVSLLLTIKLMFFAVAVATVIGVVGAWAATVAGQSHRWIGKKASDWFSVAMVVCAATPLILHAAAWEATAGKFGWLAFTQVGGNGYGGLAGVFGGLVACGWIHGLYGSSLVALATRYATGRTAAAVVGQARMEFGPLALWWKIRLPLAMPWVATAMLATAAIVATEMTVVDLYGYRTLADRFYLQYIVDPTATAIVRTMAIPIMIAGLMMVVAFSPRRLSDGVESQWDPDDSSGQAGDPVFNDPVSGVIGFVATVLALMIAALAVAVPWLGIVIKAGHEVVVVGTQRSVSWSVSRFVENVFNAPITFAAEYQWTIVLSLVTGVLATTIGWMLASRGRVDRGFQWACDCVSVMMVLIPGPIVGLAIVRLFQIDVPGFRFLYHQSIVPTCLGLMVRGVPVAYWMMRAGYRGVDDRVLQAASMELSWIKRMVNVDRPLLTRSLGAACLAAMIVASGDVPVMLPVMPPGVTTVGTRLFEQLHSGARYQEASLAIWYVAAITIFVIVANRCRATQRGRMNRS